MGRPVSMLSFIAGAPLAHTPTTCVFGDCAFSQRAMPLISAPSPTWTTTVSSVPVRRSSTPIVPFGYRRRLAVGDEPATRLPVDEIPGGGMNCVGAAVNGRHVRPERTHPPELAGVGRRARENLDAVAVTAPGIGEPEAPVTRRRSDQALVTALKPTDEVVGAAAFEASDRADVLHFDEGLTPECLGEHRVSADRRAVELVGVRF